MLEECRKKCVSSGLSNNQYTQSKSLDTVLYLLCQSLLTMKENTNKSHQVPQVFKFKFYHSDLHSRQPTQQYTHYLSLFLKLTYLNITLDLNKQLFLDQRS